MENVINQIDATINSLVELKNNLLEKATAPDQIEEGAVAPSEAPVENNEVMNDTAAPIDPVSEVEPTPEASTTTPEEPIGEGSEE